MVMVLMMMVIVMMVPVLVGVMMNDDHMMNRFKAGSQPLCFEVSDLQKGIISCICLNSNRDKSNHISIESQAPKRLFA